MQHWLSMLDFSPEELRALVREAAYIKGEWRSGHATAAALRQKLLVMVFFNPSLRTRTSFEAAMLRFGGHAICLDVGGNTWKLEHRDGVVMDGDCAEHIREAAPVLARYGDALAVRTFAAMKDAEKDARDEIIRAFARYAGKPVINMESAAEHPCQGLADALTLREKLEEPAGRNFVLTWAPHIKPLPMAVPHSAVLAAAASGMNVTIAHPPQYDLNPAIVSAATKWCSAAGAALRITNDQAAACRDADAIYVKSWGSAALYGHAPRQERDLQEYEDWTFTRERLPEECVLMHCLPVRRNVVIADDALDDPRCVVVDQAENRLWAQAAILERVFAARQAAQPTA